MQYVFLSLFFGAIISLLLKGLRIRSEREALNKMLLELAKNEKDEDVKRYYQDLAATERLVDILNARFRLEFAMMFREVEEKYGKKFPSHP